MTKDEFQRIAAAVPIKPGIYKYYNAEDKIIYVGKAKHLRKRVSSYFSKVSDSYKTQKLVSEIVRMEFTIVDSEQDALLLENSLIKQYQPKYNLMLKDDRSYPHVVIKNETFPRIFLTRKMIKDGSEYLGPYTSVEQVRLLLDFVKQTIPLRNCTLNLSKKNIEQGKFKACLEYHIGNCKAPCIGLQSQEDYDWHVQQVREIFKGKLGEITKHLKQEMMEYASNLQFEKAAIVKKKLEYISQYQSKSIIVNRKIDNVDIATILSNEDMAYVNFMMVVQGSIIQTHTVAIEKKLDESDEEILPLAIYQLRQKFKSSSREIIVPMPFEFDPQITLTIPRLGDKKKLLELSLQNANYFIQEQKRKKTLLLSEANAEDNNRILLELQQGLQLSEIPIHIECFDNSNFQGSYPVAAMVCFKMAWRIKKNIVIFISKLWKVSMILRA